jgi:DNA-binding beta-propeller fold protein YncE
VSCLALLATWLGAEEAANARSRPRRELWVTQQRDSKISILSFPQGELLHEFDLPDTAPHLTTFHSGAFAYISGMGNGTLSIVDASSRQLVQTLSFAPALCHQGKVSPDGTTMLVSVLPTQTLHRVAVDEAHRSWTPDGAVSFAPLGKTPICSVFRPDSQRAYVSMLPDGIAIVDVPSLSILGTLATDGFVACGMIKPNEHASHAVVAAGGGGGHVYTLDMTNDTLVDRGTLGAADWHSFNMTRNGALGFGSAPSSDEVVIIDLTTDPVTNLGTIALQPLPGLGDNQPDALGGGTPIVEGTLAVGLRAAGEVALVDAATLEIEQFVKITDPSPPGTFNPMTCMGCSVHGVTVRPRRRE